MLILGHQRCFPILFYWRLYVLFLVWRNEIVILWDCSVSWLGKLLKFHLILIGLSRVLLFQLKVSFLMTLNTFFPSLFLWSSAIVREKVECNENAWTLILSSSNCVCRWWWRDMDGVKTFIKNHYTPAESYVINQQNYNSFSFLCVADVVWLSRRWNWTTFNMKSECGKEIRKKSKLSPLLLRFLVLIAIHNQSQRLSDLFCCYSTSSSAKALIQGINLRALSCCRRSYSLAGLREFRFLARLRSCLIWFHSCVALLVLSFTFTFTHVCYVPP